MRRSSIPAAAACWMTCSTSTIWALPNGIRWASPSRLHSSSSLFTGGTAFGSGPVAIGHCSVQQTEERADEQRLVGRADRMVAEQEGLPIQGFHRQPDEFVVGEPGDPAHERDAVVEDALRPIGVVGPRQ